MKLLVDIPSEVESRLHASLLRDDRQALHDALTEDVLPLLECAIRQISLHPQLSLDEYRQLMRDEEEAFRAEFPEGLKPLPPEALTREGISEGHP